MKTLWKICKSIFMLLLTGVIVWTILYFTVPKVKDWTNDKVFKIDQSKDDKEKKQLRAENEDLKKQINSLTTETTTVSAELTNVKDQLSAKTTALETATSEKQELTSKVSELEQKISELETSGSAKQTELEAKKQELAAAQTSLQEKSAEVETLTSEKQTLENQKNTLESQLAEKQKQIQTLQEKVAELEEQLNPGDDYNYTVEELENLGVEINYFFSETGNTYVKTNDSPSIIDNHFWLMKKGKLKNLGFKQLNAAVIKIGDKDLIVNKYDKNALSYLVDQDGNVKSLNVSNISNLQGQFYSVDNNTFLVIGLGKLCKYNIETQECVVQDIALTTSAAQYVYFFKEANILYYSSSSESMAYFYNFNTQTETPVDVVLLDIIKVENMNYLVCSKRNIELLNLETLTFTTLKQLSGFKSNLSLKLENGNFILNTTAKSGVHLYNTETKELTTLSDSIRGLKFTKLNSGKIIASSQVDDSSNLGIFVFENNTLSRIYDNGTIWDTVVEDENGCTFSSKYDPSQGSVYYNYSTGECTAVTE